MSDKKNMTKDTIPEGFTLELALLDALPVIFFGITAVLLGILFGSVIYMIGALICFWAGAAKVIWKILAAIKQKNVWLLFMQMRIAMPVGFLMILLSLVIDRKRVHPALMWQACCAFPTWIFYLAGIIGMILMSIFAVRLDSSDPKANWIEQWTNTAAQACFLAGTLFVLLLGR